MPAAEREAARRADPNAVYTYSATAAAEEEWELVTNIHLSDLSIKGTLQSMGGVLCPFKHLRELDLDGSQFTGRGLHSSTSQTAQTVSLLSLEPPNFPT
jgi:hypothetical protein